jgi:hypothetical protein
MYPRLRMKITTSIRKQLSAHRHPCLGFLSGKCYALLMASNTSYLNVYRDASAFHTVSVHCSSPLSSFPIPGVRAAPFSVSISRSKLLWLVFTR